MSIHYDGRVFAGVRNTANGQVSGDTLFHYHQQGNVVWAEYAGGEVLRGHLVCTVDDAGQLDMRYHHVTVSGELRTGVCKSVPEVLPDGRLRLHEQWRWTSGDGSAGASVVEELPR